MGVKAREQDGIAILECSGPMRIGHEDAELQDRFAEKLNDGFRRFLFDLTRVVSVDSATLGVMIGCQKRSLERDGLIKVVLVSGGQPEELLSRTFMERVFEVFHDAESALASFRN